MNFHRLSDRPKGEYSRRRETSEQNTNSKAACGDTLYAQQTFVKQM